MSNEAPVTDPDSPSTQWLAPLEYLERQVSGELTENQRTHFAYPTAISRLLGFRVIGVAPRAATLEFHADTAKHGNQQGTIHGGTLAELADAAIGTAHSTVVGRDESFTSIDLRMTFLRPVWSATLTAEASAEHAGRTISHYRCEISAGGRLIAIGTGTVMTLSGASAVGR